MADWWPVTELACRPLDDRRVVAWQGGRELVHAHFVARVDAWQVVFEGRADVAQWAIYLDDPVDFAAALLAAWHADTVVVLPGDDRPATLAALVAQGCGLAGDLPGGMRAAALSGDGGRPMARRPIDADTARLKVFTSGSQGQAEAIDKRLIQLLSEVEALESAFGRRHLGEGVGAAMPTIWATVSHQHIYGLLFLVLWPLSAGRPLAARRLLYPEDMAACLGPAPSVLVTTPAHLKRLGDRLDWASARQGLRAVFSSGGPLPFEVSHHASATLGRVPIEVFGSSETGGVAWRQCEVPDTPWLPFMDVQWRVEAGCLAVRSPRLPDGQWWLSSDRAEPAGDGGFRLLGRADRIVKIEEKRVSLSAVERLVTQTPWVREARALVIDTPIGARVAVVGVVTEAGHAHLAQGRRLLAEVLRQALAESLEPVALPRRWRFVEALPINAQGKTPESMLKDLFTMSPIAVQPAQPAMPAVQWLARDADQALAELDIQPGLPVFDGHFPGAPILPGVAQIDWAIGLARECFAALPAHFLRLEALKFVRPVLPGTRLRVALLHKVKATEPALATLTFKLYSIAAADGETIDHASGRAVWSTEVPADA